MAQTGIIFFRTRLRFAYDPDCPPIGEFDPNKPARAFEVRTQGKVTHLIEIPFPDTPKLEAWGQARADETGFDINITDPPRALCAYALHSTTDTATRSARV